MCKTRASIVIEKRDKAGPKKLFVCRYPTDPTFKLPTQNIVPLKGKKIFEFPNHFPRQLIILTLNFTFQIHVYILLNIYIISLNKKSKE